MRNRSSLVLLEIIRGRISELAVFKGLCNQEVAKPFFLVRQAERTHLEVKVLYSPEKGKKPDGKGVTPGLDIENFLAKFKSETRGMF